MFRTKWLLLILFFSSASVFFASCSTSPSEETVSAVIRDYFGGRGYKVADLQISGISPVPLSQKTYMGTEGHIVSIRHLTLEVLQDNKDLNKGERLEFADASLRIREKVAKKGQWVIANISGIQVP